MANLLPKLILSIAEIFSGTKVGSMVIDRVNGSIPWLAKKRFSYFEKYQTFKFLKAKTFKFLKKKWTRTILN